MSHRIFPGMERDPLGRMVPIEGPEGQVQVATSPDRRRMERATDTTKMHDRQPLPLEVSDAAGNKWDVMATLDRDTKDGLQSEEIIAMVVRGGDNSYGVLSAGENGEETFVPITDYGGHATIIDLEQKGAAFAVGYDSQRDRLHLAPEAGVAGRNGYELNVTMAMFPPEDQSA